MAGTRTVVTPRGREWTVKRRWTVPGHRGTAGRPVDTTRGGLGLFGTGLGLDGVGVEHLGCLYFLGVVGVVIGVVLAASIAALVVIALVIGLLGALGAASRVLLGRPWLVEARSGTDALAWHVRGYGEAGRVVDQLAEALRRGDESPGAHGAERVVLT